MALQPFSNEQLNYLKFAFIVLNEFPKALRQTFKTMWNNTLGHRPGFQLWDDSTTVRNLFASTEGGRTRVPTNLSYSEWDCTNLFSATIHAKSFAKLTGTGGYTTLYNRYVTSRKVHHGSFHTSVVSPGGNNEETFALAIDQLRRLRNFLCHSCSSEMDKVTFDECVKRAKDAFQALRITTVPIDAVGSLTESHFPTNQVRKLKEGIEKEKQAYIKFLEGMSSDINEIKALLNARMQNIAILEQKINELKAVQDEHFVKNTNECTSILEELKSNLDELKTLSTAIKQATSETANKEDIEMLKQDIKEGVAILEQKITEMKVAQDERDVQPKHSGVKPSIPRTCLPSKVPNFTGRQSECKEIIDHVTSKPTRLVSIWGSPGFGKTSVAVAVGHDLQSQGLSVCWVSLRGLQSKADLISKLLSFVSQPVPNAQSSVQRLSREDELCQLISEISERSVFIHDNAEDLLENGLQDVKDEVMRLLEDILTRNQRITFVVTTRASLEFMDFHFQDHRGVRIKPLDEVSAQTLVHELLPNANASDCTQISQKCGHVPLAMKLLCSLISEDNVSVSQFLVDFEKNSEENRIVQELDNPDYPPSQRLQFLFDSSFQRLSAQQQEALVSLSILPENFSMEVASAVLGKTSVLEARKILQSLRMKSLLDSQPGSFTMHKLLQSFAREKGESEPMKETILNAKSHFNAFYVSRFEELNEKFLTGRSMEAFIAFYEDKQRIVQRLIEACSDSKTANDVCGVLVKAELFLDSLFYLEGTSFYKIYDSAIEAAKTFETKLSYCRLLVSKAFGGAYSYLSTRQMTQQLLSEAKEIQTSSSLVPMAELEGKRLCYLGINYLVTGKTEDGIKSLQEALSLMQGSPEQTFLRLVALQILATVFQFQNNTSGLKEFFCKAERECKAAGDTQLLIIPSQEADNEKKPSSENTPNGDGNNVKNHPQKLQTILLVSQAAKNFTNENTKQYFGNNLHQMLKEIERVEPISVGLFNFHRYVVDKLNTFDKIGDSVKLYETRITYHQTELNQSKEKSFLYQIHHEALAKCYLDLGNELDSKENYFEAIQAKQRALDIRLKQFGEEHESTAASYRELGVTQCMMGDFTSALQSHQCALAIRIKLFGEEHNSTADSYRLLGVTQHDMGDFTSALQSHQRALAIRIKLFGEEHERTADSYGDLGLTQYMMRDFTSALQSDQRALAIRIKLFGEEHESTADSYRGLGATQYMMGDFTSALQSDQRALAIRVKLFGGEHKSTADSYREVGVTQSMMGEFTSALQSHQRALAIRIKLFGEEHEITADSYRDLGVTQRLMGDFTSALQSHQCALAIRIKLFGEEHESTADSYWQLGVTEHMMGHFATV